MLKLTSFESEIIESIVWQIKGYQKNNVTRRATTRVLRATLRRIKPKVSISSKSAIHASSVDKDHAVPLKDIADKLLLLNTPNYDTVKGVLDDLLILVQLTKEEHRVLLKSFGLESTMPEDWEGKDAFARYKAASIELVSINE